MAIIRKSLKQLEMRPPVINRKLMKATSEAAIRQQMVEDDTPELTTAPAVTAPSPGSRKGRKPPSPSRGEG